MPQANEPRQPNRAISAAELARYLRSLAELQSDPRTGNPALSRALENLAKSLKSTKVGPRTRPAQLPLFEVQQLTAEQIVQRLSDFETPKAELVLIAKERFSIASSRLNKMPRTLVIETILDALRHEQSLAIIENEAQKDARLRSS